MEINFVRVLNIIKRTPDGVLLAFVYYFFFLNDGINANTTALIAKKNG